jgi:hypothetical protein
MIIRQNTCNELESEKMGLLNRVEKELVRPVLRWARPSRHVRFAGINIRYRRELDGGGTDFGQQFILFSDQGGCRSKSLASNGAADRAS